MEGRRRTFSTARRIVSGGLLVTKEKMSSTPAGGSPSARDAANCSVAVLRRRWPQSSHSVEGRSGPAGAG